MIRSLRKFAANESGATAIEYSLLCFLIAIVIVAALSLIGTKLSNTFNEVASNLS
jgi:pilus assembly protein Flp/PilA